MVTLSRELTSNAMSTVGKELTCEVVKHLAYCPGSLASCGAC